MSEAIAVSTIAWAVEMTKAAVVMSGAVVLIMLIV
jgi:hypothetical protein